jgi:hypothetical protein
MPPPQLGVVVDRAFRPQSVEVFMGTLTEDRIERGEVKAGWQGLLVGHGSSLQSIILYDCEVKTDWRTGFASPQR